MADEIEELVLEGADLAAEGPLLEEGAGRVVVPRKGSLFDSDGRVSLAIIRPCQSRGKRLRGLAPIYEASMLGRNADVFKDWHMWMGHLPVSLAESLERLEEATGRRLFSELGGRIVETWFDPEFRQLSDDDFGYRPGALMGKAIPYEASRKILEADPDGLHVSIAAWPTKAVQGAPSWDPAGKGMIIEGFRRTPRGSVDWVLRGGAGGTPVREAEQLAIHVVESLYETEKEEGSAMPEITAEQARLLETLQAKAPALLEAFDLPKLTPAPPARVEETDRPVAFTRADAEAMLAEQKAEFEAALEERDALVEEEVERRLEEREQCRVLERVATQLIERAGLPPQWTADLKRRYSVLPSGPSSALLVEATEELDAEGVLRERVEEDIKHAVRLINEAGGVPRVRGLGGGAGVREAASGTATRRGKPGAFREFIQESRPRGADPLKDEDIKTMLREGVS
jgi:hypothetical protein